MNKLTKKISADFASLRNSSTSPLPSKKSYKETWSLVAFYGKVNIRRKLRPRSAKFGSFIDFEHDFETVKESNCHSHNQTSTANTLTWSRSSS